MIIIIIIKVIQISNKTKLSMLYLLYMLYKYLQSFNMNILSPAQANSYFHNLNNSAICVSIIIRSPLFC